MDTTAEPQTDMTMNTNPNEPTNNDEPTETPATTPTPAELAKTDTTRIEPLTGSLTASTGQQLLVRRLAEVRAMKKQMETEDKEISTALKAEMIDNGAAVLLGENGVTIARVLLQDKTLVDAKSLEVKYPEIFEECSKQSQVVQLRLA